MAVLFLCFPKPKIEASLADCALGKIRKKAAVLQTIFGPKKIIKRGVFEMPPANTRLSIH
ncbi:MAG: hypothetical protein ACKOW4_01555 [Aquirufa sp.]